MVGLDLVRFLAAIMVTVHHLGFSAWANEGDPVGHQLGVSPALPGSWALSWFGWVGVQVFFVLSGVVIAYSAEGATPFAFVRSRLLRLAPAMWIASAICALVLIGWAEAPERAARLWVRSSGFFLFPPWLAGQMWTLGIEIIFYATVFVLICVDRFRNIERLAYALAALSAAYWAARVLGYTDANLRLSQLALLQHGVYFAMGIFIWLVYRTKPTRLRLAAIGFCIGVGYAEIQLTAAEQFMFGLGEKAYMPFLAWLSLICAIMGSMFWAPVARRLAPFAGPIRLAGLATYPLYLIHRHVGGSIMVATYKAGLTPTPAILLGAAASVVAAFVIARWMDPPARRALAAMIDPAAAATGFKRALSRPSTPLPAFNRQG